MIKHFLPAFLAGTTLLAGAAQAQETVTFWQFFTDQPQIDGWNAIIDAFEAENPDIDVVMEIVPWSEQQQRIVSALTTGGLPDISMLGNNVVAQFQAAGALAPLDDFMAAYDAENGTDLAFEIWPGDVGYYVIGGQTWAAPIAVETRALYYRTDAFEAAGLDPAAPPQTWEELRTAAAALDDAVEGVHGIGLSASLDYYTVQNFMSTWLGYGARMLNEEGTCGFDSAEFRAALDVYAGIVLDGSSHPDAAAWGAGEFRRGFLDGNFAMLIDGPWIWADLQREGLAHADDVAVAMVPAGPVRRAGFLGGWPLVLWNESEAKDSAAKFMLFATHGDQLGGLAAHAGFIPGSSIVAAGETWQADPYPLFVEQLGDAMAYQFPNDAIAEMGQLEVETVQRAVQAVVLGQSDADTAIAALCGTIDEVLSR